MFPIVCTDVIGIYSPELAPKIYVPTADEVLAVNVLNASHIASLVVFGLIT